MVKGFRRKVAERQREKDAFVCVGLDPLPEKIPEHMVNGETWIKVLHQMIKIIDATAEFACMFKPQSAHYEAIPDGKKALQGIVAYIHNEYPNISVFLDCKRGDIDRTQGRYRVAHLEIDGVDGMNFGGYMGKDCMEFLADRQNHPERAIVGLCYTSNPSAREVQDVILADGRRYWEFIAETILKWAEELGITENAGLVMAAAYEFPKGSSKIYSAHLSRCREIVGDKLWFLISGIGAQGGHVEETINAGFCGHGSMAINSSSGITFKSMGRDYAQAARGEVMKLNDQIIKAVAKWEKSS